MIRDALVTWSLVSFEEALPVPVCHCVTAQNRNVAMYLRSNIATSASAVFHGPMVVSMADEAR
jgi:uncharacterized protein YcsI (UPF0317 family)